MLCNVRLKGLTVSYCQWQWISDGSILCVCVSGVSLRSDFVSGFCGETEEDQLQNLSLIREDDVPAEVKQRRLEELISVFREEATKVNAALIGSTQLVLESKRSAKDLYGRNDGNVIFPREEVAVQPDTTTDTQTDTHTAPINHGDYVLVKITSANSQSLRGHALSHTSLSDTAARLPDHRHDGQLASV
ncbi:unnamed protein product [Coregonus sp. 'balchen']|nr:unnamed protein product [Coregonus sp. 'balchen']